MTEYVPTVYRSTHYTHIGTIIIAEIMKTAYYISTKLVYVVVSILLILSRYIKVKDKGH